MSSIGNAEVDHLTRFSHNHQVNHEQINGQNTQPFSGEIFGKLVPNGQPVLLTKVKLMLPAEPQKVFAVGMNFVSSVKIQLFKINLKRY